jgi:hypothetical protein
MKKLFYLLIMLTFVGSINAQKKGKGKKVEDVKNRRSSLHTILIKSDKFDKQEMVLSAYSKAPFPEKYNNHSIGSDAEQTFNPNDYTVNDAERLAVGIKAAKDESGEKKNKNADLPATIAKHLKETGVARQLVAKWFNRKEDGSFNVDLISERGFYSASDLDAALADKTVRGRASLADAGEELIKNTFVVVTKLNFVSNEIPAKVIYVAALAAAAKLPLPPAQVAAKKAADLAYEKAKEGYSVWTTAFLYQLNWNDSVQGVFYNDLYDKKNKDAFDKTELFTMKYVGKSKANSLVLFSLKEKRTEQEVIDLATIRNINNVFTSLQKKYDVFKTKTPLFTGNPITAKIGKKEGLVGGEKFEVLEQSIDAKTGLTVYKKKGVITVDKEMIYDNRFNAGEGDVAPESSETEEGAEEKKVYTATTFKGPKKFYPGMLIRQIK